MRKRLLIGAVAILAFAGVIFFVTRGNEAESVPEGVRPDIAEARPVATISSAPGVSRNTDEPVALTRNPPQ